MRPAQSVLFFLFAMVIGCTSDLPEEVAEAYDRLPEKIDFNFHVKPILSDNCYACHGPDEKARKANLRLDTEAAAFAPLENGQGYALIAGRAFQSEAIRRILTADPETVMPPPASNMQLSPDQKATLIKWLEQGGEWKPHWSFIPPKKAELPEIEQQEFPQNPIDYFVLAELERSGLSFSARAGKEALIRRVSFDLTGLPPTLAEMDAFLADNTPQAFERVVDRLLASPRFGERWSWDWLDAARYADTNGFQGDPERKMWPWRDWVIRAFNENMPYDQFTVEQLAGDLLPGATTDQVLATAFNRNHMYNGEGGRIPEETRVENVFDRVETTGAVWLGLTLNCSRCHDHKFDPITQQEYYQFFDYFNQTSEEGLGGGGRVPPVLDLSPAMDRKKVEELQAFIDQIGTEVVSYEAEIFPRETGPASESPAAADLNGDHVYALTYPPVKRSTYYLRLLIDHFDKRDPKYAGLLTQLRSAMNDKNQQSGKNLQVMVMDQLPEARPTFILDRGSYDKPLAAVKRDVPEALPPLPAERTYNRLELARWLVDEKNPLMARVTVNRFWQAFFGKGLVKTPEDFGAQGAKPSHPELLDWLAVTFRESAWDVKALCKLIVMSATYQQSSKVSPELLALDPENELLGRAPRYRLPSWMLRDQALSLSGLLQDSIGGPAVKPYQPEGIWAEATFGQKRYQRDSGEALYRRTLYTFWRRIVGPTMLFDNSARQVCALKPLLTNSPQHALTTLNETAYVEAARVMAERVLAQAAKGADPINYAFRLATARLPKAAEKQILQERLDQFREAFTDDPTAATELLSVGEYRSETPPASVEQAAYSALCLMILNLDETLNKQ